MSEIQIRPIQPADVDEVARLFEQVSRRWITCEFTPEGQDKLLASNDAAAIRRFIAEGFAYWVAVCERRVIGFIGMRDHAHLYHLFVAEPFQRQGIARRLWDVARQACIAAGNPGRFTVNSSNNALAVYEAFGFRRSQPMQNTGGVLYNPMVLECQSD